MTWGIRRIVFTIGAMLLMGGWGLTGYVDAYQHAAGAAAGERWREGEQESKASLRPSTPARTEPIARPSDGTATPPTARIVSRPRAAAAAAAGTQILRQVTPPSSWLYVLGVLTMMSGAGLMALTVPWRGARMTPVVEAAPQQLYVTPAAPPKAPIVEPPPAASFPGVPSMPAAQSMAAAPMQQSLPEPTGKGGLKPLKYKKGA